MKKFLIITVIVIAAAVSIIWLRSRAVLCLNRYAASANTVVVYVSEDQVFSEPILRDFEKDSGIKVRAIYDTEEAKSTGAMNRLIAEKNNPQADVYWANEPIRAEVLKQKGISQSYVSQNAAGIPAEFKDPQGFWTGFSARTRVLVVNSDVEDKPSSIMDYVDPARKGRGVIANPLFGTTTSQMAALFTIWPKEKAEKFLADIRSNGVTISTDNGESSDFVADGRYDFSLVDSDDAINRMRQGRKVSIVYPDQEENGIGCFIVPNAVLLIKGAPHPETAAKLIDYLLSKETERKLALADCAQIPLHSGVKPPIELKPINKIKVMQVDYAEVAKKMVEIQPFLKSWVGL